MARLPPLKSLQAFEAVSRHLSLKLAAEELCVTPTAISHQIKAIEGHFGVKLFLRLARSLALTNEGQAYAPLVREAFDKLDAATAVLNGIETGSELIISTTRSFASTWLGPRLNRFRTRHPSITVRLYGEDSIVDFARDNVDIAIRHGQGNYPDMAVAWVLDDFVSPVCTPALAPCPEMPIAAQVDALLHHPIIHYEWPSFSDVDPSWAKWLDAAGVIRAHLPISAIYSDEQICLQDAVAGHGIALISLLAAAMDIESGRLVAPCDILLGDKSYFAVCPKPHLDTPKVAAFREWLLEEADAFRDGPVGGQLPGSCDSATHREHVKPWETMGGL